METYRGYRGLRREGIGTFKARTAVGRQPTEVTGVEEGREWHFQRLQGLRREGIGTFKARTAVGWQPTGVTGVEEGREWHFQS